jgi:hypothetical protein
LEDDGEGELGHGGRRYQRRAVPFGAKIVNRPPLRITALNSRGAAHRAPGGRFPQRKGDAPGPTTVPSSRALLGKLDAARFEPRDED